jgi:hypothetical protein
MVLTEIAPAQPAVGPDVLDVTVVLPVYNEKGHLVEEIDRIRRALLISGKSFEILVVDDGSDDGSGEQLRAVDGIRLLQFRQNRGSGSARKAGTRAGTRPGRGVDRRRHDVSRTTASPSWSTSSTGGTRWWAPAPPSRGPPRRHGCRRSGSSAGSPAT